MSLEVRIRKRIKGGVLDVRFEADSGIFALLGEKDGMMTLVLKCIAGIETPDEGRIALNGVVLYDSLAGIHLPPARRRVGYLFPGGALFPTMTVEQNLRMALMGGGIGLVQENGERRVRPAVVDTKVSEFLREYQLDGLGGMMPGDLSPAQRQQAAFARMMAGNPQLVLLDDPFLALDGYRKADVLRQMQGVIQRQNIMAVLASTDLDEVYAMGDNVAAIRSGRSEPMQGKDAFFEHPGTLQAAILTGVGNIGEARLVDPCHALVPAWGTLFSFRDENGALEKLPTGLKAIGIRAQDLTDHAPQDEDGKRIPSYHFSVYRPVTSQTRLEREVRFCPCRRGEDVMVMAMPKAGDPQPDAVAVQRVYVRTDRILRLT